MYNDPPHVRQSEFQNPVIFFSWNPEFSALESTTLLKESGILINIGFRNTSSTDMESEIHSVESRFQDCLDRLGCL